MSSENSLELTSLAEYDPLKDKTPSGVIVKNSSVKFKVYVNQNCTPNELYLMIKEDSDEDYKYVLMQKQNDYFVTNYYFENFGHYFYCFKLNYNDFSKYLCKSSEYYSVITDYKGEDFLQLVTSQLFDCDSSMQGGIIYQILPDRFCRDGEVIKRESLNLRDDWGGAIKKNTTIPVEINKEVFGGNIKGIISKLDYLAKLGVTIIYLNPIFLANSHHKYDVADYFKIDDMLGTEDDFKNLINQAEKHGIKIVIDCVFNHTGSDSIYFNKENRYDSLGAYNSKNSPYYDWYTFENYPEKYDCWWGIVTLPSIKKDSASYQNYIAGDGGVLDKYLKLGVYGVRLDVVDELSDEFVKRLYDKVKSYNKNSPVIGEVWEDASTKISYSKRRQYFSNNEINSVMNYPIKNAILDYIYSKEPQKLLETLRFLQNSYPKPVLNNLMNIVGTHDTSRIFSEIKNLSNGNVEYAKSLFKIAYCILFTLPGVPCIYYGDEYGMENNDDTPRGCFDWNHYENDIYLFVKTLSKIRKFEVFKNGQTNIIMASNGKFVFERFNEKEHIVVLVNLRNSNLFVELHGNYISYFTNKIKNNFYLKENEFEILIEI